MMLKFINPRRQWLGAFVPNWLLERSEITQGAKLCYARLCQFWNEKKGYAWPRQTTLASSLGIKERQLRTYLAELEGCKLVDVSQPGLRRPNEYRFLYHPWMADDQEPLQVVVDRQKTATPDRQDTATQDRTYTATPISRESVEVDSKELERTGDVAPLVRHYRTLPGISPSAKDGGVIAGLVGQHGAEVVRAVVEANAAMIGAAQYPLQYLVKVCQAEAKRQGQGGERLPEWVKQLREAEEAEASLPDDPELGAAIGALAAGMKMR